MTHHKTPSRPETRSARAHPLAHAGHANRRIKLICAAAFLAMAFLALQAVAQQADRLPRVLSVGGSVTEIIYALGQQDRLIARDSTSMWPSEAMDLPDVGYMRSLSPEGVLSVGPDMIIAEEGSGPAETIAVLEEAAIEFITVPDGYSRDGVRAKILAVAEALGVPEDGAALAAEVDSRLAAAEASALADDPKRVLFVLSTRGGRIMASGTNTAANGIFGLAGGVNAIQEFEGYKPLTDEAIIAAAPDVILMMARGGNHATADKELFEMPAIASTPAGEAEEVVRIDGLLLLGFGPRTPEAVTLLNEALYGAKG